MELFQFQEEAAASISDRVADYLDDPITVGKKSNSHQVGFFQAVSALTGAGKTLILAAAVAQIAETMPIAPVILWLSRGRVVVQQSLANLSPGGKYHELLHGMTVSTLADYGPMDVANAGGPLVYFATVGTFNQKDKEDGSLRIHKSDVDNLESSTWEALSLRLDGDGNRRPLVIVYDEAHNLSDQQTNLLLELEPDVFLPATATMRIPQRLGEEIAHLKRGGWKDEDLTTKVISADVVSAGLVKSEVLLEGYNAPMEETVANMLLDLEATQAEADALGLPLRPKAIYVCDTNVVADTPNVSDSAKQPFGQRQAPPILIWRYLTEQMGVDPATVAVYSDLKTDPSHPLPDEFNLYKGADSDYDEFIAGDYQHIIFNLRLQEGWDDPSVYFAYVDKSMESNVQITQVIGRVLRQPNATHYSRALLNTAHFYVRVDKNSVFNEVVEEVKKELGDAPGGIRIVVSPPGKPRPQDYSPNKIMTVPETGLDPTLARDDIESLMEHFPDFRNDSVNTTGKGSRRILRQVVGAASTETQWEAFEQASHASARWVVHRELQRQFKATIGLVNLAEPKLDASVGIGSSAFIQAKKLADELVETYVKKVRITQRRSNPYIVGSITAQPDELVPYNNSLHDGYAGLNPLERPFADSLDKHNVPWARNPPRSGYGIPLVTPGATDWFYPDFLIWTAERVICVDTKGGHLVLEAAARKLLTIRYPGSGPRLEVHFVSKGKLDEGLTQLNADGFTGWTLGDDGSVHANHYEEMEHLVDGLIDDSKHPF